MEGSNCNITVSPPSLSAGGTTFSPEFWKGGDQEKMSTWGGLKEFLLWIISWVAYYGSC